MMIALELVFSEIPSIVAKYTKSLMFLNTRFIVKITGNNMKGIL